MALAQQNTGQVEKKSPFTVSLQTDLHWETLTTREKPSKESLLNCSEAIESFCHDLAVVGLIGSVQARRIYLNNNKNRLNKAVDLKYLKKHEITRGNNKIPVYTLGAVGMFIVDGNMDKANEWKTYSKYDVLRKLVFFQLYGSLKQEDDKIHLIHAEKPFEAAIHINGRDFHVLVVRGNENEINHFFRYESEKIPKRILLVVEDLNQLMPVQNILKPYFNRMRLTTDHDLNESFSQMFYQFKENKWQKENVGS